MHQDDTRLDCGLLLVRLVEGDVFFAANWELDSIVSGFANIGVPMAAQSLVSSLNGSNLTNSQRISA